MTGPASHEPRTGGRLADPRVVRRVSTAIFIVIGCVWALSTPLMAVPDEPAQIVRAASLLQGQLRGDEVTTTQYGDPQLTIQVTVPKGYALYHELPKCHWFLSEAPASCAPEPVDDTTPTVTTTYIGAYPPLYYWLVGWPSRLFGTATATYLMRLISAVLCGVLLGWGVGAAAGLGRSRFALVGAGLAATPMVFFVSGAVNPSGLEITAAFALWFLLTELLSSAGPPTRGQLVRVTTAAALLTVARPLGPAYTLCVVAALTIGIATRDRLRQLVQDRRVWIAAGVLAAVGLLAVAWSIKAGASNSLIPAPHGPVSGRREAFLTSLGQTEYRARQMVGYFGWLDSPPPFLLEWGWFTGVGIIGTWALVVGSMRQRLLMLLVTAGTIALPVVFETQTAARLGYLWQGRYSLPIGVGVPIVAGWIVATRTRPARWLTPVTALFGTGVATGGLVGWATMMTRYDAGASSPLTTFLHAGNGWHAPLPNLVLAAIIGVASVAFALLVASAGRGPDEPDPRRAGRATDTRAAQPIGADGT